MPLENASAPLIGPAGLSLCPISPASEGQIFKVCAALTPQGDGLRLVTLRTTVDARVYLAALTDAASVVREWLELWVQALGNVSNSTAAQRDQLSNEALDRRWKRRAELFRAVDAEGTLETGWDELPPSPVFLDPARRTAIIPTDPLTGASLALCRDDALLSRAGLPAYSTSLHRYWQTTGENAEVRFAVTVGAPTSADVVPWSEGVPALRALIPFNPGGGRLWLRRFSPLAFEEFSDLLGGKPWKGVVEAREPPSLEPTYRGLNDWDQTQQAGRHLFLGSRGRAGLLTEALHLKLRLFADAVEATRTAVKLTQLPLLNLSDRAFRIELTGAGSPAGLPVLWTGRVRPALPGQALALSLKTSSARYFLGLEAPASSIYRPRSLSVPIRGIAQVRLRRFAKGGGEEVVIEGTLVTHEKLDAASNDLVWIQFPLGHGLYDLFAKIDYAEGLAKGEARFRTIPQEITPEIAVQFRAAEGVPYPDTAFETIPLLSTPCDLYALGVLGVRTFLCNASTTMGVALDELFSLARELRLGHQADLALGQRVRQVIDRDPRLLASLGPHRLLHTGITPQEALASVPAMLWWDLIGTLARFFPGTGPDAFCKDFSDVSAYKLDAVFEAPVAELNALLVRTRSLVVIDWSRNREIAQQIKRAFEANLL